MILATCQCHLLLSWAQFTVVYFILLICSIQHFVQYWQCYGSVYHCFSTFWALGFAALLDLLILSTCICFVPISHICILPISFFYFVQCNILYSIVNVMALFITVFPLIGRWDLHSLQLILSIICIFRWDLWNMNVMPSPITLSTFRPQGRMTQNQPQNFHLSW